MLLLHTGGAGDLLDVFTEQLGHVAEHGEDNEAAEKGSQAVHSAGHHRIAAHAH